MRGGREGWVGWRGEGREEDDSLFVKILIRTLNPGLVVMVVATLKREHFIRQMNST